MLHEPVNQTFKMEIDRNTLNIFLETDIAFIMHVVYTFAYFVTLQHPDNLSTIF